MWSTTANVLNKQLRTADKRWYSSLGGGRVVSVLTPPHRKRKETICYEMLDSDLSSPVFEVYKRRIFSLSHCQLLKKDSAP
jgi:hypothetical protein